MAISAEDLKNSGINIPLIVGGAALSKAFTEDKIAKSYEGNVYYAKDAMSGLEICNKIIQ
jgi:5-methyltetrahydrofolate--homocysteine methyltransferase